MKDLPKDKAQVFNEVAEKNIWGDAESRSGPGSNLTQTKIIRPGIVKLVKEFGIKTMLDAPCGDFYWMKEIKQELSAHLDRYIGGDIVAPLIEKNNQQYGDSKFQFQVVDITRGPIPPVDLIFTRDCFIHLSYSHIYRAIRNYQKSGAKYLLVSTYTKPRPNVNVEHVTVMGRALNLERFPFNFPRPVVLINEGCTEAAGEYADKSLALWEIKDLSLRNLKIFLFLKSVKVWLEKKLK